MNPMRTTSDTNEMVGHRNRGEQLMKKISSICLAVLILLFAVACGAKTPIDYGNAESFEAALNAGKDLEGAVVQFEVSEFHPESKLGYNIWAGEHLNFISSENPKVQEGDIVTARINSVYSMLGSWIISYEKVNNAVVTTDTITAVTEVQIETNDSSTATAEKNVFAKAAEEDELVPVHIYLAGQQANSFSDTRSVDYAIVVMNPSETLIASSVTTTFTIEASDGTILAMDEAYCSAIMPMDVAVTTGTITMTKSAIKQMNADDGTVDLQANCRFVEDSSFYRTARTTDFTVTNVSVIEGAYFDAIAGKITSNYSDDVTYAEVVVIFKKDDEAVYIDSTIVDNLRAGATMPFKSQTINKIPDYDSVETYVMAY